MKSFIKTADIIIVKEKKKSLAFTSLPQPIDESIEKGLINKNIFTAILHIVLKGRIFQALILR